jgi:D-sedoheptulose 7-phosphate isomerase
MFSDRFQELAAVVKGCSYTAENQSITEEEALRLGLNMLYKTRQKGGTVYVIGNGGSAGIASHFSIDLIKACQIPSQTFYDSNWLTALSNDWGYDQVFSYPLAKLARPHDLLVAISSSGQSPNILRAVEVARSKNIPIITLSGFLGKNPLRQAGHLNFWIDRSDYGVVETAHFFLLHTFIDFCDKQLSADSSGVAQAVTN